MTDITRNERSARYNDITAEIDRLTRHRADGRLTEPQGVRLRELHGEKRDIERDMTRDMLNSGVARTERGTPDTPYREHVTREINQAAGEARRAIANARDYSDEVRHAATLTLDRTPRHEQAIAARYFAVQTDEHYRSAFCKLLADPQNGHREFTHEELRAFQASRELQRTMSLTDSAGGYLVPADVDFSVRLTNTGVIDPVRQVANVVTTFSDTWSGVTSAGVTASWDAEGAEVSDDAPTLAQPNIPTYKNAMFIGASLEVAADGNVGNIIAGLFSDAKANLEAAAWVSGSGSGQPTGFVTALAGGSSEVGTATDNAFVAADVYSVQNSLSARWQGNASFQVSLPIINKMRQFDVSNSYDPLVKSLADGPALSLLGKPLHENSSMDSAVSASDAYIVAYGDFRAGYTIVDRIGLTVAYVPMLFGSSGRPNGKVGWYGYSRSGGDVLIDDAIRILNTNIS